MTAASGLLYAVTRGPRPGSGPFDLDPRGVPVDRAIATTLALLRARGWSGVIRAAWDPLDPGSRAVAGLLRVAAAEEGPLLRVALEPSVRLVRLPDPLGQPRPAVVAASGPWSARLARAIPPASGAGALPVVAVEPPADAALRALDPERAGATVARVFAALVGAPGLVIATADDVIGRPFSALSAALAGAVGARCEASGVPVLALGPTADAPAPPHLGVSPLAGPSLAAVVEAALTGAPEPTVALDVEWGAALAAFPHLREVAGGLLPSPIVRRVEVVDVVRAELSRLLGLPRPATHVPVRDLGLDSVGGSQLRVELERRFGVALPATLVFDHPTPDAIADRVLAELTAARSGSRR